MPRYKLIIEYDGTPFSGWQIQDNAPTVQGAMETAVKAICGEKVRVHGSGRTDAGVHALGQVAHCDIEKPFPPGRLRDGLNAHLRPHPIGVLSAEIVADDFEARFSARKRHYLYRITNHRANLALDIKRSWRVPRQLDTDAMHVPALVPAQPGALDGRFAGLGRRRPLERGRPRRRTRRPQPRRLRPGRAAR